MDGSLLVFIGTDTNTGALQKDTPLGVECGVEVRPKDRGGGSADTGAAADDLPLRGNFGLLVLRRFPSTRPFFNGVFK